MPQLGKNFRLPRTVLPRAYQAELTVDLQAGRFQGDLEITLEITKPERQVFLHAVDLAVTRAELTLGSARIAPVEVVPDQESETVTLTFAEALRPGQGVLKLSWTGAFSPGLRGLYRAGALAVTQFEAADARRVFPCFDEPAFKATWDLRLRNVPSGVVALSNGPVTEERPSAVKGASTGARDIRFATTPVLSSYLVALVLGELASSEPTTARGIPIRTWAVPNKKDITGFAQEVAASVLPHLEDYFDLPYPFGKLDQVGVPDFEAGAMENAGCVTFREVALLIDPATTPLVMQKRVAEVITHELAHQWFGNLVTMVWWDDLWLNEAFATWMAYKVVDIWKPEWRVWMDFEVGKGAALMLDALRSAHPIRSDVNNAEEAGESFDAITYEKGGAVLRMMEGYLGQDPFRAGIRLYMRKHRFGNATADDLWGALAEASGEPIVALANGWIRQTGYPVLSVRVDEEDARANTATLTLAQRRFLADAAPTSRDAEPAVGGDATAPSPAAATPTRWLVPVVVRYEDDRGVRTQRVLLEEAQAKVTLDVSGTLRWCVANAGAAGFYRTQYETALFDRLRGVVTSLDPAERLTLVSDQWALVRVGEVPATTFLDLASSLASEQDHFVLDEVVSRLGAIEHRFVADADRPLLQAFIGRLLLPAADRLGWAPSGPEAETDDVRLLRAAVLRATVLLARIPQLVAEAEHRFLGLLADPNSRTGTPAGQLDPNLLDVVVIAAARSADETRFATLLDRARNELDPVSKRRFLHALARVETPALLERAVELALTDTVPMQDFTSYLSVLLTNRATRELAWSLIRDRWDVVRTKASSPMLLRRLVEGLGSLTERHHLDEVRAFLERHPIEAARQAISQTLERMQIDASVAERLRPEIASWLRGPAAQPR